VRKGWGEGEGLVIAGRVVGGVGGSGKRELERIGGVGVGGVGGGVRQGVHIGIGPQRSSGDGDPGVLKNWSAVGRGTGVEELDGAEEERGERERGR